MRRTVLAMRKSLLSMVVSWALGRRSRSSMLALNTRVRSPSSTKM
jgi:hypothetical protein